LQINLGNQRVLMQKNPMDIPRPGNLKATRRVVYDVRFAGPKLIGCVRRGSERLFVEFDPVGARPFWKPSEEPPARD